MNTVLIGVAVYVALQLAIGAWVSRDISSERDYINAGRRIGVLIASFSVFGTWFGAEAIVGSAGTVYASGLVGGTIDPFGYSTALIVVGLTVAMPLWRRGYVTFADFFRERYSPAVERLAILLILPGPIIWGAAQLRAFGQVIGSVSEIPLLTGIAIAAVVAVGYTVMGGLMADALTDFIQGLAVIAGLLILGYIVAGELGGVGASLAKVAPERIAYFSSGGASPLQMMEKWAIPIFGTIVSVELISRILGTRSAATARNACIAGGVMYVLAGLLPVYVGLVGPQLMPGLEDSERIVPELAQKYMSPLLQVIFIGAIVSAILSTVDSVLLSGGSIIAHNVVSPLRPGIAEAAKLRTARASVVGLGVVAFVIALKSSTIHGLVETASAIGSAGLFVVTMFGLFTRLGGPGAAVAAMLTGALVWASASLLDAVSTPYLLAVASSVGVYLAVALGSERVPRGVRSADT